MACDRFGGGEFVLERELGITIADLHRVLPRVVAPRTVERLDTAVSVDFVDGRMLIIEYSPERQRRIAALRMPYIAVKFRFKGWDGTQRADFIKNFERAFHKGGG